jgi:hypothetical protein
VPLAARSRQLGLAAAISVSCLAAGCGQLRSHAVSNHHQAIPSAPAAGGARARPQAVQPVAGAAPRVNQGTAGPSEVSVGPPASGGSLPQPTSLADVKAELRESGATANPDQATLTAGGLAIAPVGAPPAVQAIINAGNQIAHLPYRFGGGHGTYEDTAYDCSGSLSFVLAAAGLLSTTVDSGQLMSWGLPGPGKWITVFANPGHTFMYVAGLRFDTVALAETGTRWSDRPADDGGTFVERHPAGL